MKTYFCQSTVFPLLLKPIVKSIRIKIKVYPETSDLDNHYCRFEYVFCYFVIPSVIILGLVIGTIVVMNKMFYRRQTGQLGGRATMRSRANTTNKKTTTSSGKRKTAAKIV